MNFKNTWQAETGTGAAWYSAAWIDMERSVKENTSVRS